MLSIKNFLKGIAIISLICSIFFGYSIGPVFAKEYPAKAIQIIVPWSAGDTDLITRLFSSVLPNHLGQPAVVMNKAGAQGIVGTDFVFKAPPDGYTFIANGPAHMIVPKIQKTPFSADDFIPLVQMARNKGIVVVKKDAPWATLNEFIAKAKEKPGTFNYGSPGKGTWHNFKWEIIKDQTGLDIVAVPFKGNAPILAALLGGHIDIALIEKPTAFPHIRGGTVRPLAISDSDKDFPEVKTFEEQGVSGDFNNWKALFGHKGIPKERIEILVEAFRKTLTDKSYLNGLKRIGSSPGNFAGDAFHQFIIKEDKTIAGIVEKVF